MQKLIILVLMLVGFSPGIAQQVTSAFGGESTLEKAELAYTLGEPIVGTIEVEKIQLTQGYHQPNLSIQLVYEKALEGLEINVFPNPTSDKIYVEMTQSSDQETMYELTLKNLMGQTVQTLHSNLRQRLNLDVSGMAAQPLFLEVKNDRGEVLTRFKVLKVKY